jgi:hypothetical protein
MDDKVEEKLQATGRNIVEALFRYLTAGAKGKPRQLSVMIADEPAQVIRYLSNTNLDSP